MIYGYYGKKVNVSNLLEMKEITFSMSPEMLRVASMFLKNMADMMDNGGFENCSHRHITSEMDDWSATCDIIVTRAEV